MFEISQPNHVRKGLVNLGALELWKAQDMRVVMPLRQNAYTFDQFDNPSFAQRILELLQKLTLDLSVMLGLQ